MFGSLAFVMLSLGCYRIGAEDGIASSDEFVAFICMDSSETSLINVCDGHPHCPDSSDETASLCRHIVCPANKYRCAYGACVNKTGRCNGFRDCIDGSDEFRCDKKPDEICPDDQFQCSTVHLECVSLLDVCDGRADCSDESDEINAFCGEYPCPEDAFRCSYGGCVHQEVVCDGVKDCIDGSDEDSTFCAATNCEGADCARHKCRNEEFRCEYSGQCISNDKICDGIRHCRDGSDEEERICIPRECSHGLFRCAYGACIPEKLKCNRRADCYDWSDEEESICGVSLPNGACRLPGPSPATHYKVTGCRRCRPGDVVPQLTRLDYTCDIDGSLEGSSSVYCRGNRWFPAVPICPHGESLKATCPPVKEAFGAIKRCESKWGPHKGWVPCDRPLPVGTRVTLECPDFYERRSGSSSIVCIHDGTWTQQPLTCSPICGVRTSPVGALIVNGWEVEQEDSLPWHATLYSHEDGQWKFFCGGTLLAERVVLTAGHCVWKTFPDTLRVAFGVISSDLNDAQEGFAQILDVESIELQRSYQDHAGNYGSDLALLILKRPVRINSIVMPACVDWKSDVALMEAEQNGGVGLVAGMGITENDTFSSRLRQVAVKVVSDEICRERQKGDFRKYLTYTSFCAGWTNGTSVCNGDSGGGLVLQRPNATIWEVHGVVSISPRKLGTSICDPNYYTIFTKVSPYTSWIRNIVENIPVIGPFDVERQPNRDDIVP